MASLLMWTLVLNLIKMSFEVDCKKEIIKNAAFHCEFQKKDTLLILQCESTSESMDPNFNTLLILQLFRKQGSTHLANFQDFFDSNFISNSSFYSCDNNFRNFIHMEPTILTDHCKNYSFCIYQASNFINESDIKIFEVSGISEHAAIIENIDDFFPSLVELNIHHTSSVNFSEIRVASFKKLETFLFMANDISFLPNGIFAESQSLRLLDLSKNKISFVTNSTFGGLPNLQTLNLSVNSINWISKDAFNRIPNLKYLYLKNNKLRTLNDELFNFNYRLEIVDLSNNNIRQLPKRIFYNLRSLKQFYCIGCELDEINEDLFANSTGLLLVDLSRNRIKTIPPTVFDKHLSLEYVDFSFNKLSEMPMFRNKSLLKVLYLIQNEIMSLSTNLSVEAPNIFRIKLSQNRVELLTDDHIKHFKDLEVLDLTGNKISVVELGVNTDVLIRKLMLSNNSIKVFKVEWRKLWILELLELENNEITYVDLPPCIPSVKQTITFSFQNNKISRLGLKSLIEDERRAQTDRSMGGCFFNGLSKNFVDLSFNPLICDCELYPFYSYMKHNTRKKLDTILNQEVLTCFSPTFLQNESIISLPDDVFSCSFEMSCPSPCKCGIRGKDDRVFVNCTGSGLDEVPQSIPLGTTVLYLNRNVLSNLDSMNNKHWNNLTELHVDYNELTSLDNWKIPDYLQYLSLRGNDLKSLPQTLMDFISNQSDFQLMFGENDKNCDCGRKTFKKFLQDNIDFVKDIDDIVCEMDNNGTKYVLPLYIIPNSVLCTKSIILSFDPQTTLISLCAAFGLLIGLLLFYYKQRQLILSFLYIHCDEVFRVCFEENDMDSDKIFDAFIAYSSFDRPIVMHMLHELEEKEPHFQLCIHERDWLPGRFISDNIISSVQSSKRTIVILSNDFIASPWFRLELRAAIFKVSGDKKNKLIVILADKATSLEGIDTEIRHVISKRTYLVWGERWFWEKLRYAMPRQSCMGSMDRDLLEDDEFKTNSDIKLIETSNC